MRSWLLNAQNKWPDGRFWQRDVGLFKTMRNTTIKVGMKGQSDVYGFIPYGEFHCLWIEIEFKTLKGKQTKPQKNWSEIVRNTNGLYVVVRNDNQFLEIESEIRRRNGFS